ncbi:MAG: hypothetical protein ACFCUI_08010 [Bernardetiaceae bacterium]
MKHQQKVFEDLLAKLDLIDGKVLLCTIKTDYIPSAHFRELFSRIEAQVKAAQISKFILDGRSLRVFQQSVMSWYYLKWRTEMLKKYGLKAYREIEPEPAFIKESIQAGKEKLHQDNPWFNFSVFDFKCCKNLEDAINE